MIPPIFLTGDEHIPLYLQLVHQFRHLITSRQLDSNDRLPSVRDLAAQLEINPGTVALAYRTLQQEGLIESQRGRGTFVTPLPDEVSRFARRQEILRNHVDSLIDRAYALGYDAPMLRQAVTQRLQQVNRRLPILVVMPSMRTSRKYAPLISASLPPNVEPVPVLGTLAEVRAGDQRLLGAENSAYFAFTFASSAPTVSSLLKDWGAEVEVVGITAQLTEQTKSRLKQLDPSSDYCLVGESRNVSSALNLVATYSRLDARHLTTLTELSDREQFEAVKDRIHLHSFGSMDLLDRFEVPQEQRLQLEFTLSDESRLRLSRLFSAHDGSEWLEPQADFVG